MKSPRIKLIILVFAAGIQFTLAQWQPGVRLSDFPNSSRTNLHNARNITSNGNMVHLVWEDFRFGASGEIYYKRSTDAGLNWGADTRLTNNSGHSIQANIAVSGQVVHVVWRDSYDGNPEVYYKRSTDGGLNWGADTRLTNNAAGTRYPIIAVTGQVVHVVFDDDRDGNYEIYYKRSTDAGASWGADTRLTNESGTSYFSSVAVSGQLVHVTWEDSRNGSNREIYYKRSTDGGTSWGADTRLTNNPGKSYYASVAASGQAVYVVWNDDRDGNMEIYCKTSSDGGVNWGTDTRLTNNPTISELACVTVSGSAVHVVWNDAPGQVEILYRRSVDGGVSWEVQTQISASTYLSEYSSVSVADSVVHVIWEDFRDGSSAEIYYSRNPTGNPNGIILIGSNLPAEFSLTQNYPNPFNPVTNIEFGVPQASNVKLTVYDLTGRIVAVLVDQQLSAGKYRADFDASELSSGTYFYCIEAGKFTDVKKMVLLK